MKKQINPTIKAHLTRHTFWLLLLLAVCAIPFALAQSRSRGASKQSIRRPSLTAGEAFQSVIPANPDFAYPSGIGRSQLPSIRPQWTNTLSSGAIVANAVNTLLKPMFPTGGCNLGPWSTAATGPRARYRAGAASDGNYIYVFGGGFGSGFLINDLWRWNPATQTWTQLSNMPTSKQNIQGAYWNGKIYVPGGFNGAHITENVIYDIATNTWAIGTPLPAPQSGQQVAFNNKIYNFGGQPGPQMTVRIYDIATNTWSTGAPMPVGITYGRATVAGSYAYYAGGVAEGTTTTNTLYRYDFAANSWATMAPLQTARTSEELMTLSGPGLKLVAVMGGDASFFTGVPLPVSVEIYDIASNAWSYGNPVVTKAAAPSGGIAGGKAMVQGGVDGFTYYDTVQISLISCGTPTPSPTASPTPTATATATPTPGPGCGLLVGSGLTIGFAPNNFTQLASNIVNYTFANSQTAPLDYAIFQTHNPWGATAVHNAIAAAGHTYSVLTPAQLAGFPFSSFRVIVLNWDDTYLTDFLGPYTSAIPALEAYVNGGGVVWVQGAVQGATGDFYPLPFGGQSNYDLSPSDPIVDPISPMVQDVPNPIVGDYASQVADTSLPVDAHVAVINGADQNPVLYDLRRGTCGASPTPTATPTGSPTCTPGGGKIYNIAGFGAKGYLTNTTRIYDIPTNTWTTGAPLPTLLSDPATAYWSGKIYVAGGYDGFGATNALYTYDIASNSWTKGPNMPTAVYLPGFGIINGKLYIASGNTGGSEVNTLQVYDIASHTWIAGPGVPTRVTGPGSAVYHGKLYLFGGGYPNPRSVTQIFDPKANSWSSGPNMNVARLWFYGAAVDDTSIVAPGGEGPVGFQLNDNEQLTAFWEIKAPLPYPAGGPFVVSDGTFVYIGGGWNGFSVNIDLLRYDPVANSYTPLAPVPDPPFLSPAVLVSTPCSTPRPTPTPRLGPMPRPRPTPAPRP